jgi:hypothetical protein
MGAGRKVKTLQEVRKDYILKVLKEAGWDYGKASRILEVPEDSLKREIKKIAPGHGVEGEKPRGDRPK